MSHDEFPDLKQQKELIELAEILREQDRVSDILLIASIISSIFLVYVDQPEFTYIGVAAFFTVAACNSLIKFDSNQRLSEMEGWVNFLTQMAAIGGAILVGISIQDFMDKPIVLEQLLMSLAILGLALGVYKSVNSDGPNQRKKLG